MHHGQAWIAVTKSVQIRHAVDMEHVTLGKVFADVLAASPEIVASIWYARTTAPGMERATRQTGNVPATRTGLETAVHRANVPTPLNRERPATAKGIVRMTELARASQGTLVQTAVIRTARIAAVGMAF